MSYQGHIENGVVVFDEPTPLPEGAEVRVDPVAASGANLSTAEEFWREWSIDELVARQGMAKIPRWDDLLGQGAALWDDDVQFEDFVRDVHNRRREGISS